MTADGIDDSVRIDGLSVIGGLANGGGNNGLGAGMFILNASPAVVRVTFTGNAAPGHGGGAMDISGNSDPIVVNTSFIENAGLEAGALHTEGGAVGGTFVNCLFIGNASANEGGAINSGGIGTLTLINCTLADTSVSSGTGAGAIYSEGIDEVNLTNCILWGNLAAGIPVQIVDPFESVTVTYSDVQGGWAGEGNLDPALDPLFVDAGNGDYRLTIDSPCIDFGDPDETVIPMDEFDVDQDGDMDERTPDLDLFNRVLDGDDNGNARVDMGSYEFIHPNLCPWDLDGNCMVGVGDLLILLANWANPYGVPDLLELLADWGPCPQCSIEPLSLAEELADACLTQDDWDEFEDVMTDPESSQEDKDRYLCWMTHYLDHCNKCTCTHIPMCPGPDPFS